MVKCKWFLRILLLGVALLTASMTIDTAQAGPRVKWNKIDPALAQAMKADPDGFYRVIIESETPTVKKGQGGAAQVDAVLEAGKGALRAAAALDRIVRYGGEGKNSLALIGAATANVNYDTAARLSRDAKIRQISLDRRLDAADARQGKKKNLASIYTDLVRAPEVWDKGYTGEGVTIAIVDSGLALDEDYEDRVLARVDLVDNDGTGEDPGGHGSHVAGIAAGFDNDPGGNPNDTYGGIAPGANLVSVRVINENGAANFSTVIRGIQWVIENRERYNIRVLNLSLGGRAITSYKSDPLVSAVEIAWHAGIVVVAAAGNQGPDAGTIDSPGIDPFSITVGALDDNLTITPNDDSVPYFTGHGPTLDGIAKPDLVAPGRKIVSVYAPQSRLSQLLPDRLTPTPKGKKYFRLTGTSQATPVVAGVVALMLQKNPELQPDEVKYRLMQSATALPGNPNRNIIGAGRVDALNAVMSSKKGRANEGLVPSDGFAEAVYSLVYGQPLSWKDPNYQGIQWANLTWNNLTWNNLTWNNLKWDNLTWNNLTWNNLTWDNLTWDSDTSWDSNASSVEWSSALDLD